MTKTSEYPSAISDLVNKVRNYKPNLGSYEKHYINKSFDFRIKLSNNYGIKISRILAQDYLIIPNILTEEDLKKSLIVRGDFN